MRLDQALLPRMSPPAHPPSITPPARGYLIGKLARYGEGAGRRNRNRGQCSGAIDRVGGLSVQPQSALSAVLSSGKRVL